MKKAAFTLAEVLITLAIIGVVAAMTIPALLANHRKQVVETRLAKFYSSINQAVKLSENDNGDMNGWTAENTTEFWDKYFAPYLNYVNTEDYDYYDIDAGAYTQKAVYFSDGSLVLINLYKYETETSKLSSNGGHFYFFPVADDLKRALNEDNRLRGFGNNTSGLEGRKVFTFGFWPNEKSNIYRYHKNQGVEPYVYLWDGDYESLKNSADFGCNTGSETNPRYCLMLIKLNGWKIPKDYPFKL